ncbi:hypothetical protein D3C86_1843380 [compost metagenome]
MSDRRLNTLAAWHESSLFSERERAALEWAEALTRIGLAPPGDEAYAALQAHFTEKEIVDLTYAITQMNAWNRLSIAFKVPVPV